MNNSDGRERAGVPDSRMARRALVARGTMAWKTCTPEGTVCYKVEGEYFSTWITPAKIERNRKIDVHRLCTTHA